MSGVPDLMEVMTALYASEINCSIASFHDGGWIVKLGDEMNGFDAEARFGPEDLRHAARWLAEQACELYPASEFARLHPTPKLVS